MKTLVLSLMFYVSCVSLFANTSELKPRFLRDCVNSIFRLNIKLSSTGEAAVALATKFGEQAHQIASKFQVPENADAIERLEFRAAQTGVLRVFTQALAGKIIRSALPAQLLAYYRLKFFLNRWNELPPDLKTKRVAELFQTLNEIRFWSDEYSVDLWKFTNPTAT